MIPQLQLRALSVHHPGAEIPALDKISLLVQAGEQVAIIGPSGAGKTTLLHTLGLAQRPTDGILIVFGTTPWKLSSGERHGLRRRLFLAPQSPPLPPRQRVINAVLAGRLPHWGIWRAIRSLLRAADPQVAFDALARFQLQDKLYSRVDRLSGGERQRCGMARLVVSDAELLLVDEPLSALDPMLATQTLSVVQNEASRRQAILICSLHQVELARAHFPRIVGLRSGRVVFDAPREEVTDAMIDALYVNTTAPPALLSALLPLPIMPATTDMPRC